MSSAPPRLMTILLIVNLSRTLDRRATSGSYTDPVGVGEHQVVVIGYEAGRGRGVPGGQRGIREVEQLVTPFVAEGAQIGFDLFYGLLQLRPARPRLIRCKVARISVALTTCLSSMSRVSSSRRKSLRRVHRPTYGGLGTWAWRPTRRSMASRAGIACRSSSICRARVARFSSPSVRIRVLTRAGTLHRGRSCRQQAPHLAPQRSQIHPFASRIENLIPYSTGGEEPRHPVLTSLSRVLRTVRPQPRRK